jgi:hypothetical protein
MRAVSSRDFDISLSGGSVRRVRREVRLATMEVWGVHVRLMMMGRMSTVVPGQCCRLALARGCICLESFEPGVRGCGLCGTFIPLFELFN